MFNMSDANSGSAASFRNQITKPLRVLVSNYVKIETSIFPSL